MTWNIIIKELNCDQNHPYLKFMPDVRHKNLSSTNNDFYTISLLYNKISPSLYYEFICKSSISFLLASVGRYKLIMHNAVWKTILISLPRPFTIQMFSYSSYDLLQLLSEKDCVYILLSTQAYCHDKVVVILHWTIYLWCVGQSDKFIDTSSFSSALDLLDYKGHDCYQNIVLNKAWSKLILLQTNQNWSFEVTNGYSW